MSAYDIFVNWMHWRNRDKKADLMQQGGTRYYGDGGTIHSSGYLDVETDKSGKVVAVWFRCSMVPFKQTVVDKERAEDMKRASAGLKLELRGLELRDLER